jgi:DNA topoisomerase VI subunit A
MRDVRFNPDRYLSAPDPQLIAERRRLIAESQRLRTERASRPRRHEVFLGIRKLNAELVNCNRHRGQLGADADLLARQLASNRLATSREFFYASTSATASRRSKRMSGYLFAE